MVHTENDRSTQGAEGMTESGDDTQEKGLRWLLEMDLSEPQEKLFTLSEEEYQDEGLSEYEAEVAGRPLVRGNAGSDDFASYVAEEIVISSDDSCSDIYAAAADEPADDVTSASAGEAMAIDYSRKNSSEQLPEDAIVNDGSDILGLDAEDDMGEKFLTIKRVKAPENASPEQAGGSTAADPVEQPVEQPVVSVKPVAPEASEVEDQSGWLGAAASDDGSLLGSLDGEDDMDWPVLNENDEAGAQDVMADDMATLLESVDDEADLDSGWSVEEDASLSVSLSDAPVPCLVAEPGAYTVANEEPVHEDTSALETAAHNNVVEYVANTTPPVDDEEFDQYLLSGEHLLDIGADPDDLVVQRTEGIVSVDPSAEADIDYHEDFRAMEGFGQSSVSSITGVIAEVVADISGRARQRLSEIGCADDCIEVDIMLGSDPESIKRCYAEGFEPVTAVCVDLPEALQGLGKAEQDALYVRLFQGQTNESWNDLFSADFTAPGDVSGEQGTESAVNSAKLELVAPLQPEQTDFAEDFLGDECTQEFELGADAPLDGGVDIDAMFDDFLGEEPVSAVEEAPAAVSETPATEDVPVHAGFGEDIFAGDFAADFALDPTQADAPVMTDINAAFGALEQSQTSADAICGVDVDEFVETERLDEPVTAAVQADITSGDDLEPDAEGGAWCIPEGIAFSHSSQGGAEIFADFLDAFIEEGSAEVEKLEDYVGEWEKDLTQEALFASVTRILHTIKGIAKGVGLQRYGTLIHNYETLLEALPRPETDDEQSYFRIVNAWLDAVVRGIEHVQEHRADIASEFPLQGAAVQVAPASGSEPVVTDTSATQLEQQVTVETAVEAVDAPQAGQLTAAAARQKKRDQQLADDGAKALAAQQSVRITSEKLDHLLNLASQAQQLGVRSSQTTNRSKRATSELQGRLTSVRSHIGKIADRALLNVNARGGRSSADLDALEMDQYSELQEAASILREGVEDLADLVDVASRQNALIEALLKQQSSVISSITSSIQAARVVPVSRLMPGLRRLVRTVSTDLDKAVSFKVLNETGALDRDHYARCQVVLEHMVRNALDHGIETPEERMAAGKPTAGRITIDVRKSGGDYVIRLADDGKGIDPEAIRESAYEKGLDVDVDALSDEEVIRLIFHKGFSTANTVSEISGRGVGMDIVMTELQQIGGDIQIQSAVGLGTSFEVRIPSNLTVNGALFVTAGENSYAVPLNGLIAVEHVPVEDFYTAVEQHGTLQLFDMECEAAYLATLCQGESLPERSVWGATVPVIIAGSDDRYMAIAIDNVKEALELVVRSLGAQFSAVPGIAGAATTADGEAIVALDLNLLVKSVVSGGIAPVAVSRDENTTMLALVVDDSRTQRMVATSQLDTVGVETVTAENGLVAIDLLNATHRLPDVVLLDVEMPVKDGIETLREIRKSTRYGHLPVIMVTSRTGAKHRALAKEAGCNAYMGKPFNFPALIEQISDLTGHDLQLT